MIPNFLKSLFYATGLLDLFHQVRNRHTLTVVMFHRVLATKDPRWNTCDPDYTIEVSAFADCLDFFEKHYSLVSLRQVLEAQGGGSRLPPCSLLLTFDDGWADNVEYALPLMRQRGTPGAIFVVADAVGRDAPFFQEQLMGAWRSGRLSPAAIATAVRAHAPHLPEVMNDDFSSIRRLIRVVEALDPASRERLMGALSLELVDGHRHMVTTTELVELEAGGVAVGVHGKTHLPMTAVTDLDAELSGARNQMAAMLRGTHRPACMSFPHGQYDQSIASRARDAGFELLFTSVPCINLSGPARSRLLGRLGFSAAEMLDGRGALAPYKLAMYLFFRARQCLS